MAPRLLLFIYSYLFLLVTWEFRGNIITLEIRPKYLAHEGVFKDR